jgi:S-methylmethionine-dependent homocysteine/selenocysteine methylase
MARYRHPLPQLSGGLFLTDGGIEPTLIFHERLPLPYFAAFDLLKHDEGYAALQKYFRTYADIARRYGVGCILERATWRASPDWGTKLGYSATALTDLNRKAITLLQETRDAYELGTTPMVISGCIGP